LVAILKKKVSMPPLAESKSSNSANGIQVCGVEKIHLLTIGKVSLLIFSLLAALNAIF
jgi:hypothetical protein